MKEKLGNLKLQLNSLNQSEDDFTILKFVGISHDFELSKNSQIVTQEVCEENLQTLIGKPITAKYIKDEETDNLAGHGEILDVFRENEELFVSSDALAIGHITDTYIKKHEEKKVLFIEGELWLDRYPNICSLLLEWQKRDIAIYSSVEYKYKNYNVEEGIEYIKSPIYYLGQCILASETRGDLPKVEPAYDSAQLLSINELTKYNKLVAKEVLNKHKKEDSQNNYKGGNIVSDKKDKVLKKICELSQSDVRTILYAELKATMSEADYDNSYIVDIYETYFILNIYDADGSKYYKVTYSKSDDDANIDYTNKSEVEQVWQTIENVSQLQTENNQLKEEIETLKNNDSKDLISKNENLSNLNKNLEEENKKLIDANTLLKGEKVSLNEKLEEASNKAIELNKKLEETTNEITNLTEFKEKYIKQKNEALLEEAQSYFKDKFEAVNAKNEYNSEEVQNLIKLSINETDEGKNAKSKLTTMLIDLIDTKPSKNSINTNNSDKHYGSSLEDLIKKDTSFDSRYGE